MSVEYKIVKQCQPGIKGGGEWKYYARVCNRRKVTLETLSKEIERQSSLSEGDVVSVLTAFTNMIPDRLKDGDTLDLGSLGLFSISIKSKGKDTPEEVTSHSISGVQINYRPSVRMKREMKTVNFKKGED